MGFDGLYWISLGFRLVILGPNGFYWVQKGLTGLLRVTRTSSGLHWLILGFWWVILGFDGFHLVMLVFWWVILSFSGLHRSTGLSILFFLSFLAQKWFYTAVARLSFLFPWCSCCFVYYHFFCIHKYSAGPRGILFWLLLLLLLLAVPRDVHLDRTHSSDRLLFVCLFVFHRLLPFLRRSIRSDLAHDKWRRRDRVGRRNQR